MHCSSDDHGGVAGALGLHLTWPGSVIMMLIASLIEDARRFSSAYADYYATAFDGTYACRGYQFSAIAIGICFKAAADRIC
jgi:hypothetical protein